MGAAVVSAAPIGRRVGTPAEDVRNPTDVRAPPAHALSQWPARAAAIFLRARGDVGAVRRRLCLGAAR